MSTNQSRESNISCFIAPNLNYRVLTKRPKLSQVAPVESRSFLAVWYQKVREEIDSDGNIMSNLTDAKLEELTNTVVIITGNADQFFLIVMGCLIFCKYICYLNLVHIMLLSCWEFVETFLTLKIPTLGRFQNVAVRVFSTSCKVWKSFRRLFSRYSVWRNTGFIHCRLTHAS